MGYCSKANVAGKSHVGIENSRILDCIFHENRNISSKEAFVALQEKLKGQLSASPTIKDGLHWLKYRKSRMRAARSEGGRLRKVTDGRVKRSRPERLMKTCLKISCTELRKGERPWRMSVLGQTDIPSTPRNTTH